MNLFLFGSATSVVGETIGLITFLSAILALIYFLFPFIVMVQLMHLNEKNEIQIKRLDAQLEQQKIQIAQQRVQIELSRQLLRAHGHEPEA
jgi:hypothetical protein